jgi:aminopeptidase N
MELALDMKQREQIFELELPQEPLRIDIDPSFDLFRRLDRAEIPPALSGAFGADTGVFVLPGAAAPEMQAAYRKLAEAWENLNTRRTSSCRTVSGTHAAPIP